MASRERLSGVNERSDPEQFFDDTRKMLEERREEIKNCRLREESKDNNPGVVYAKLVSEVGLADEVWYKSEKHYEQRGVELEHKIVLELTTPSTENQKKAHGLEKALIIEFPWASFTVSVVPPWIDEGKLSDEAKATLIKEGYGLVSGVEKDAPHNPL